MLILQLSRNSADFSRLDIRPCARDGVVRGIRLRADGDENDGVGEGKARLRQADLQRSVDGGLHDRDDLRVRKADVLARADHQAAADGRQVARREQPREVVDGGVRVGAAHRFLERRDEVVVLVAVLVIADGAALRELAGALRQDAPHALRRRVRREDAELDGVHRLAHVAAAGRGDELRHAVRDLDRRLALLRENRKGAAHGAQRLLGLHGAELKDGRPA